MLRSYLQFILIVGCIASSSSSVGSTNIQQLAEQPYWRALLHFPVAAQVSDIKDSSFFLSEHGSVDPQAELIATVENFKRPVGTDPNSHAQCRFIARKRWLIQNMPEIEQELPTVECPLFNSWTDQQGVESISVIFASGYLGNPASFYGHIMLKLNSRHQQTSMLQQQSLNFGAKIPDGENPLVYIAKGLFGGYEAVFSHGVFYKNVQAYGEAELRDLWEYKLALTPDEVRQLVFHAWELIGRDYQYFFMKENCAFRMAELLELVVGTELVNKHQPWAMPVSVFHKLATIQHNGQPLVANIEQHPSRQARFYKRYMQLNPQQVLAADNIVDANFKLDQAGFLALSVSERSAVLEMLFDYLEFLRINHHPLFSEQAKQTLLTARLKLPVSHDKSENYAASPPHLSTLPSMLQFSALHGDDNKAQLRFRATYYDLLTADTGRAAYSALSMFDLTLALADDIKVQRFELLNIENMNLSTTGLPGDGGYAWQLNIGYVPLDIACKHCNVTQLSGGIGKAAMFSKSALVYAMANGRIHNSKQQSGMLSVDPRFGMLTDVTPWWRMQFEIGRRYYIDGDASDFNWYQWQHRFGSQQHWDVRLGIQRQRATEITLAYSHYW